MNTSPSDNKWPAVVRSVVVAGMITGLCVTNKISGELALAAITALAGIPWLGKLRHK